MLQLIQVKSELERSVKELLEANDVSADFFIYRFKYILIRVNYILHVTSQMN